MGKILYQRQGLHPYFHTCHILKEERMGKTLTNLMRFHYIELPKVTQDKRSIEELTEEARFLEYLKYAGEPNDRHDHEKDGS